MKIESIAHLARLQNPSSNLQHDLEQIVRMVTQIQSVNTDVMPMSHPLETQLYTRPDLVNEPNQWPILKKLAPKTEADLFLVPTVIE